MKFTSISVIARCLLVPSLFVSLGVAAEKADSAPGAIAAPATPTAPPLTAQTREIAITGQLLLLPIAKTVPKGTKPSRLEITVGDQLAHRMDVLLANTEENVAFWANIPMREYVGKIATLKCSLAEGSKGLELAESSDAMRNLQTLYSEPQRPQLRFSQARGWSNDPNGMVYYAGEYHLFFQSNPVGNAWGNMYWGHAVSKDLIHWTELPLAMRPFGQKDTDIPASMAKGSCFSGGACVDINNTLGKQQGDVKTLIATFTDTGLGESVAYSTNKGRTWINDREINPIIKHRGRDPRPFWHAPSQSWVIVVYDERKEFNDKNISFYRSKDFKTWELVSHIEGYYECPEFFELPVDGDKKNTRWVLMGANAQYQIGSFDGQRFTPENPKKEEILAGKIYAGQRFSDAPDGRIIYIGWAQVGFPDSPFNQGFTLPIEFTLRSTAEGVRLFAEPVKEFDTLRNGVAFDGSGKSLNATNPKLVFTTEQEEFDIVVKVRSDAKNGVLTLKLGSSVIPLDLTKDDSRWRLVPNGTEMGTAVLRVVCDRSLVEVCSANGRRYQLMERKGAGSGLGEIALELTAGEAQVEEFKIYNMKSIWR